MPFIRPVRPGQGHQWLRWCLAGVVGVLYAVHALTRHQQFLTAGYDLGIFDQAVRAYSQFRSPMVPIKGDDFHLLGDHFHPILVVLAPLYWVWDDPRMLLLAQAALVASSIPVVWGFAERHVPGRILPGVLAGCYALSWPLQRMIDFDFHEIAFAVPLLALAIDALDRHDDARLMIFSLLLLLVREDMGMLVVMIAVVRCVHGWNEWRLGEDPGWRRVLLIPLILSLTGLSTFIVVTTWVLPHFSVTGQFAYWNYPALGADPPEAIRFMLLHPLRTSELLFVPVTKSTTWALLFLPLLLFPLRSWYTLIALPLLLQRFLSGRAALWTTEYHYSAPILVILFLASVEALDRMPGSWRRSLAWMLVAAQLVTMWGDRALIRGGALDQSHYPLYRLTGEGWHRSDHMHDQQAIIALVPASTCIEVDDFMAPHLTRTHRVTLPTVSSRTIDFILLDMTRPEVHGDFPSPQEVQEDAAGRGYTVVAHRGEMVLLQRPGDVGPSAACAPDQP